VIARAVNILLVDDDPGSLELLQEILAADEVNLVLAISGEQALREIETLDFAAVVLDVGMPGMSGFALARCIRSQARSSATPIIFVTGADAGAFPIEQAYALGAVDYLSKPVNPIILRAKVTVFVQLYQLMQRRHQEAERERLLTQVRADKEHLADVFKQAPAFMAVLRGPEHVFEMVNDGYLSLVGNRPLIGLPVRTALPELAGQGFFELLDTAFATGERFVGIGMPIGLQHRPGGPVDVRLLDFVYVALRDAQGAVHSILAHGVDQTERKQAEATLRESEAKFRTIANAMPQVVWSARPDGAHDYFNQQWYDFTGLPEGSTDGDGWSEVFHPDDRPLAWALWRHSLATGELYENQSRLRHHSGQYRWALARALPVRDDKGCITRWMGTCTDIHDQKLAEDELRQANRHKDEFLAMLAHELRNPLAPISTAAHLLALSAGNETVVREVSAIISRQVAHMTELVDDLLDISRVTRGLVDLHIETIDLKAVVANALEQARPLIDSRGHALVLRLQQAPAFVAGDKTRLVQALANLLNNAAKYTPKGGQIVLELEVHQGQVRLSVSDNGSGIASELLPHIFELFTQAERTPDRSQGGLGMGLALVKHIVALHGGTVEARSEGLGQGSVFMVTLPLREN